jgi:hypothetical protein
MTFGKWFDTLISEKGINPESTIDVEGKSGTNIMPLSMVFNEIKDADASEQAQIKNILVAIDFKNGDILHFIKHLAQALAI